MPANQPKLSDVVYELVKVVESDVEIGDDRFPLRVELFQNTNDAHRFRARIWRTEMYRIQSTFPQDELTHEPVDRPSDETILVDHSLYLGRSYSEFEAESQEAALQLILKDYRMFLAHVAGKDNNGAKAG